MLVIHEERFRDVMRVLLCLAEGDHSARVTPSTRGDEFDGMMITVNMLGEELEAQSKRRAQAEGLLGDALDSYESAPAFFCSVDAKTLGLLKCNERLANALGRTKDELHNLKFHDIICEQSLPVLDTLLSGEAEGRLQLASPDGPLEVRVSISPAEEGVGVMRHHGVTRHRIVMQDISEQRRLEARLFQVQKMEAVGQLAGGIAHDFNNLLTVIFATCDILKLHDVDREQLTCHVDDILKAVKSAAALTRRLVTFSGQQYVPPQIVEVSTVLVTTVEMLRPIISENIVLTTNIADGLGRTRIDPTQLEQVVLNLVVNAGDAMPEGGRLEIVAANTGALVPGHNDAEEWVHIIVSDTGAGMSSTTQERACDPFFSTKSPGQGRGLGLATCYGIISGAGGRMIIESEVGRGTAMHIYLPRTYRHASGRGAVDAPASSLHGKHLLVVEDLLPVRQVLSRLLRSAGCIVTEAGTGAHAIEIARTTAFDALVTDVVMPNISGPQLVKHLRASRPNLLVLYISGYAPELAGLDLCNERFLQKPYTNDTLLKALGALFRVPELPHNTCNGA